ncbi:MAG: PAS domain S-box protein [Tepidisphaeraceae bacterium]|jgi:PAS domain S-box-containing protein
MAGKAKPLIPPALDFLYAFYLSDKGKAAFEWTAGPFSEITGYPAGTLEKTGLKSLIYPKDARLLKDRPSVLLAGQADVREYRLLTADGHLKWLRDYAQPIRSEPDGRLFVIASAQEITTARRSQEEMRRLASIIEHSQDAIMDMTLDGVIVNWNRAAERIYGYASDEVKGRSATLLVPADRMDETARILSTVRRGGVSRMETLRVRKNGAVIPVALTVAPVRDALGQLVGTSTISRDISQLKNAESALQESATKTASILTTMVDGVVTIDERGMVDSMNPAAERLFGYAASEVFGRNVKMLMPEPYKSEHDEYLANYLRTGVAKIIGIGREVVGRRKNGSTFPMDLAVSEMLMGPRRLFTGIVRDLTDRKRLEREILEISDREQRRIGQDLHDGLGQQLAGIGFLSKALEQRLQKKSVPESADASEIAHLVSGAIAQARGMAHGLHPVDLSATGLMSALKELALTVEHTFRISCTLKCEEPVLLADNAVGTHIYRITQEAVNNAIKHGKAEHISIVLIRARDTITASVRDDGVGFPEVLPEKKGMGLQTMRYRAALIGATLSILRLPTGGTRVDCALREPDTVLEGDANGKDSD